LRVYMGFLKSPGMISNNWRQKDDDGGYKMDQM
jgi:hypothetical protein